MAEIDPHMFIIHPHDVDVKSVEAGHWGGEHASGSVVTTAHVCQKVVEHENLARKQIEASTTARSEHHVSVNFGLEIGVGFLETIHF